MKKYLCCSLVGLVGLSGFAFDFDSFVCPKKEHRPETWFHLIGGNVAKEGLIADLDALQASGISGIHLFTDSSADLGRV